VRRRLYLFVALALALAAVFVRLGVWQLSRLAERRAQNERTAARLNQSAVPFLALTRDTAGGWLRQAVVEGTPDYDHDFVVTGRSYNGSPGVHIFTPIRVSGNDTAILVNRGWVYAPDAATADLARWHEQRAMFHGFAERFPPPRIPPTIKGRQLRPLGVAGVDSLLPYPFYPLYLVDRDSSSAATPARLEPPDLGNGPHLSYAIQWFSFALIAVVGAGIVWRRSSEQATSGTAIGNRESGTA
jgi:surfeit locus 1 family protein